MGPIDYSAAIVNPLQSVLQGFQLGTQLQAAQDVRAKERAAAEREQAFMQEVAALPQSATGSQDIIKLQAKYPEKFDMLSKFWGSMGEQKRNFLFDSGKSAIMKLMPGADGKIEASGAIATLEERAVAAENMGDKQTAKELRDTAQVIKDNPANGRFVLSAAIMGVDKDRGKAIVDAAFGAGPQYDTPFLKELIAEGKTPGSPEWNEALARKREGDPWVVVPGVGLYLKRDIAAAAEGGVVAPTIPDAAAKMLRANPKLAPQFDQKYGPGAANRILGGPTQPASGGFQPRP